MTHHVATVTPLHSPQLGAALLGVLLCGACGSSDRAGATGDAGADADFGGDVGAGSDSSGGHDAAGSPDGAHPADAAGSDGSDSATGSDGGNPADAGDAGHSPAPVSLGTAGAYVILAKSGISTVPTSTVTGALGVSPAAASYITGFALTASPTNVFSTSPQVTGKVYASDYAQPTPARLTTAVGDMQLAFTDAAGRAPDVTELGAGNVGGMTLAAGVYAWSTGLLVPTNVTLSGTATDVWIFQVAKSLTVSSAARVQLSGGALAKNVFWQVSGTVALGTTAHLEGIVLAQTAITLRTGASINGRLLAQTAVSIDGSTVVQPQ